MIRLFIILLCFTTNSHANYIEQSQHYFIGDEIYSMNSDTKKEYIISNHCIKENAKCEAVTILKNPPKIQFTSGELKGGKNPGSVICKKYKDAYVVIGSDLIGNQQSFCLFKDKSIISTGILSSLYK